MRHCAELQEKLYLVGMGKEKKISVRTPSTIYTKLMQRAYELDLNHREYYLALAIQDLEKIGEGQGLTEREAKELKAHIKELDQKDKKNSSPSKPHSST